MIERLLKSLSTNREKNAMAIGNRTYCYTELAGYISAAQSRFERQVSETPVGIVLHDDIQTYSTLLAAFFLGHPYVIINPTYPAARNLSIIQQAGIRQLFNSRPGSYLTDAVMISDMSDITPATAPITMVSRSDDSLFYILFTSGSTGTPKGVRISYGNVKAFVESFEQLGIGIRNDDRVLQMFDLTFDVSVAMLFLPLLAGACLYTVPSGEVKNTYVFKLLIKHQITYAVLVPSILSHMRGYFNEIRLPWVRLCAVTAEASMHELLLAWKDCVPNAEIWNLYGPTEATVWCFAAKWNSEIDEDSQYHGMIPIGHPMPGVGMLIRDYAGEVVTAAGKKGELLVSGPQVTPGYLNHPDANQKAFIELSAPETGKMARYYKTGDLIFLNPHGETMYCGRLDNQVQLGGFRVELNEVEHHARPYSSSGNAVALAIHNAAGSLDLFLALEQPTSSVEDIRRALMERLPAYMVPRRIFEFPQFPVNSSNKIDRQTLLKRVQERLG